ncbi:hypothetical protein [Aquimarina sp. RZ0]|uniref:hypothetical protein n=1 Tax=Aquimarina sp. RZ0 TaxID=2607730 RepID=UPI0011F0C8DB|nr:hypothetical protein [Aquimarina sp. RZ0]KAA1242798.1 hypothetical protein F0000_24010 [Aquimarina sp. RZ0]
MLSIIVSGIGLYFVYRYNIQIYNTSVLPIKNDSSAYLTPYIFTFHKVYRILAISIALLSIFLGLISWKKEKSRLGLLGIIVAIILIICSYIPFTDYI